MKKTIILCFIMLLSFVVVGCSNSNTNNKENTLTCKWNSTENQYLNVEFIFNFNENDELISVDENQSFDNSHTMVQIPSNTVELKEKIEEIKYVKADINVNKSSKDMFFNYMIDVNSIKKDLYDEIITTDTYEKKQYKYPYYIFTLSPEFLKEYIHYSKETLKVKLISDLNFNCK